MSITVKSPGEVRSEPAYGLTPVTGPTSGIIVLLAFLFTAAPAILFLWRFHTLAPIYSFDGDAFYYFDIARNSLAAGKFTFDGSHVTNGFHPMWEWVLYWLGRVHWLNFQSQLQVLRRIYALQIGLLATGGAMFCLFASQRMDRKYLALSILAPGPAWFLLAATAPDYLATWSYLDGMECALEVFLFALAMLFYKEDDKPAWIFAALLGLAVMTRLDDVFILLAFAGLACFRVDIAKRGRAALTFAPPIAMLVAYVVYNRVTAGSFLPISGASKAGFGLIANLKATIKLAVPVLSWDAPRILAAPGPGYSLYAEQAVRIFQMVFPAIVCGAELIYRRRAQLRLTDAVSGLCVGVLLKFFYNFVAVALGFQGVWYYAVPILTSNFVIVLWIDRYLKGLLPWKPGERRYWPFVVAAQTVLVALSFNIYVNHKLSSDARRQFYARLTQGERVRAMIASAGGKTFVEFDDGALGYVTDLPSVSGFGLAMDAEAGTAVTQGDFLHLMETRGVTLMAADDVYGTTIDTYLAERPWERGIGLWELKPKEFRDYAISKIAYDAMTGVSVYRLSRGPSAHGSQGPTKDVSQVFEPFQRPYHPSLQQTAP